MDEYATYKIWNGRKEPHNIEFNGRLIGEKVISTTPTTQVINDCGKYYCQKCGYVFRYKKDAETFNFCPCCGAKVIHDHENA